MTSESIAERLGTDALCVCPGFLSSRSLKETREDLGALQSAGKFVRAGTGQGTGNEVRDQVRRDEINWFERGAANPAQENLWAKVDDLKQAFNRTLFLGLSDFEGHYSAYPAGGFYRRHLDSFHRDDARTVSLVLYLNADWSPSDGGSLRIYHGQSHTDVPPVGGTMVCFLSRESEHEVLQSYSPRLSFTGWFKQPAVLKSN